MKKDLKYYQINLVLLSICYILLIIFNFHLFNIDESTYHFLYGISIGVICILVLYSLVSTYDNVMLSTKITSILSPIMTIMSLIEAFMYENSTIVNLRIILWLIILGGIILFISSKKIQSDDFI